MRPSSGVSTMGEREDVSSRLDTPLRPSVDPSHRPPFLRTYPIARCFPVHGILLSIVVFTIQCQLSREDAFFQVALILHHLKDFINPWLLNYCSHIVRYFYLVVRNAYRQLLCFFSILYLCACSLNDFYTGTYFMHINVSGRSVLLFNKLI